MFAVKNLDADSRLRQDRNAIEQAGAHGRRQRPKTPVEQALMRGLTTA
jgi:hypothetical protein